MARGEGRGGREGPADVQSPTVPRLEQPGAGGVCARGGDDWIGDGPWPGDLAEGPGGVREASPTPPRLSAASQLSQRVLPHNRRRCRRAMIPDLPSRFSGFTSPSRFLSIDLYISLWCNQTKRGGGDQGCRENGPAPDLSGVECRAGTNLRGEADRDRGRGLRAVVQQKWGGENSRVGLWRIAEKPRASAGGGL